MCGTAAEAPSLCPRRPRLKPRPAGRAGVIPMRVSWLPLFLAASALACSSCGKSGLYPVSGKVLYKGEPAAGATVSFVRKGAAERLQEPAPQGVVQEDGS